MQEIWKEIPEWEGLYEASSLGRIRSLPREGETSLGKRMYGGAVVKPIYKKNRHYYCVNLTKKSNRKQYLVHRLILEVFKGSCPKGMQACHNDGNPLNNTIDNLRWDTAKNNHADKKLHGTHQIAETAAGAKLTNEQARFIRESKLSANKLSKIYPVGKTTIYRIKNKESYVDI